MSSQNSGNACRPAERGCLLEDNHQLSERRACTIVGLYCNSYRYQAIPKNDDEIRLRLQELGQKRRKFGAPRLHTMLRRERLPDQPQAYRTAVPGRRALAASQKAQKAHQPCQVMDRPSGVNQHWSMDFISDTLYSGRRFQVLTIVDDFSRECPGLEADHSPTGKRVTRIRDRIMRSAQRIIETWRQDYNSERPHSSLSDMTPEEFAATLTRNRSRSL
ncbi:hypothetical protein GEOBC_02600 [Geobacteraceae bacterium]|nr:hypothetical protein GEOBC_02600 [Geobacteraceae bacterium]